MAGENDCLFPSKLVIPQAKTMIPNCTIYLLKDRGHMHYLTEKVGKAIIETLSVHGCLEGMSETN